MSSYFRLSCAFTLWFLTFVIMIEIIIITIHTLVIHFNEKGTEWIPYKFFQMVKNVRILLYIYFPLSFCSANKKLLSVQVSKLVCSVTIQSKMKFCSYLSAAKATLVTLGRPTGVVNISKLKWEHKRTFSSKSYNGWFFMHINSFWRRWLSVMTSDLLVTSEGQEKMWICVI